ncbi:predicted protein [Naegleria gruberi]|uniref:Predicted protein n=1 Tax=Naegleria gruberi TaxID=5762 RepID=D2VKB7_NAEGR|nr:uncharacterized protein NAEGRDRAFT_69337 [Naegleria gruberi]EFC42572.1 predicted protein [Naegleria gruberi]|eukprot:XP_002675316.1 predicted protein [Naegleria gruberi strain NEG-M]
MSTVERSLSSSSEHVDPILQIIIMEFTPLVDESIIRDLYLENGCDFDKTINELYFILSSNDPSISDIESNADSLNNISNVATFSDSDNYQDFSLHSPINRDDENNVLLLYHMFKDIKSGDEDLIEKDFIQFLYEENDKDLFQTMEVLRRALCSQYDDISIPETSVNNNQKQPSSLFAAIERNKPLSEMARELPVYFIVEDEQEKKKKQKQKQKQKTSEKKKKVEMETKDKQQKMKQLCEIFPNIDRSMIESQLIASNFSVEEATLYILNQTTKSSGNNQKKKPSNNGRGVVRNDLLVGGSRWSTNSGSISPTSTPKSNLSLQMKKQKLSDLIKGKGVSLEFATEIFAQCNENLTNTIETLAEMYPNQFKNQSSSEDLLIKPTSQEVIYGTTIGPQSAVLPSNIVNVNENNSRNQSRIALDELMQKRKHFQLPDLVDTESSYLQASNQYTKLRDKFMELAVRAQQNGNYGLATNYMSKARQYSIIVENCHDRANEISVREQTGGKMITRPRNLDLHGLVLQDALETLEEFLNKMRNSCEKVNIITGSGKHSKNNQPVLLPAVNQYLLENGYDFKQLGKGVFQVKFR